MAALAVVSVCPRADPSRSLRSSPVVTMSPRQRRCGLARVAPRRQRNV